MIFLQTMNIKFVMKIRPKIESRIPLTLFYFEPFSYTRTHSSYSRYVFDIIIVFIVRVGEIREKLGVGKFSYLFDDSSKKNPI